ncbi:hypothetical protein [Chitinibacter tainanensis]|uniref:hypothetical protein n=1 Tax=Chitinibacter tainanensis TaxID=230667 RepID=UPI00054E19A2|nr:hypothetical protein [Chitinibacter tainanensis]
MTATAIDFIDHKNHTFKTRFGEIIHSLTMQAFDDDFIRITHSAVVKHIDGRSSTQKRELKFKSLAKAKQVFDTAARTIVKPEIEPAA